MNLAGQHILSTKQFDKEGMLALFEEAARLEEMLRGGRIAELSEICAGKMMASVFFEPSTRTRFSFETAMQRLGGRVVSNFDMMSASSLKKGETLYDTGKVISQMVDVIAMRHPEASALHELAEGSDVPVLNAGNGSEDHPTQALLDCYTIWKHFGGSGGGKVGLDGLTVGLIGDLKYSRVLHSQVMALRNFDVKFVLVSPSELQLPDEFKKGCEFEEGADLAAVVGGLDVISVNRIQEERFADSAEAERYRGKFVVSVELLKGAREDAVILCPLPRREELPPEVDADPRAKYFEQVGNGVIVRMALLKGVLNC